MNLTCGILVTYHPPPDTINRIVALSNQVANLVIIDNGSGPNFENILKSIAKIPNVQLFRNSSNLGIAKAFNQGLETALNHDYDWAVTFDQDSDISPDYIKTMLKVWQSCPYREKVAIVAPSFLLRDHSIVESKTNLLRFKTINVAMASGNLVHLNAVKTVGLMEEDFFIDYVDFEYCLRLRRKGWKIIQALTVLLPHRLGQQDHHNVLGIKFSLVSHSSLRRYYITRNRLITYRRHGWRFPAWLIKDLAWWALEMLKLLLFESGKREKLRCLWLGLRDACRGRLGPAPVEIQSRPHAAPART